MTEGPAASSSDSPNRISDSRLVAVLYLSLVGSAITLLWGRFNALPTEGPSSSDLLNYFVPLTRLVADRLGSGELPLWNIHGCNGIPLLATAQVGALYPGILLSMWLPGMDGLHLLMFLQCVAAGAFMALALRAAGNGWLAASAGAIAFATACVIGSTLWPPQTSTLTWVPWLLLCIERLSRTWQWRWWLAMVAGTALGLLAGFPQYLVYGFALLGPYAIARVVDEGRTVDPGEWTRSARLFGMAGAVVVGTAIAGAQLLPTLELTGLGARSLALPAHEVGYLRLGTPGALAYLARAFDAGAKPLMLDYGRGGGYVSIALLILLPAGVLATRRSVATWTLLGVGAAALLLSDGPASAVPGVAGLYELLPGSSVFRSPERLRLVYLLALIVLSVRGLDAILRLDSGSGRRAVVAWTALGAGVVVAIVGTPDARVRAIAATCLVASSLACVRRPALAPVVQAGMLVLIVVDLFFATAGFGLYRDFPMSRTDHLHTAAGVRVRPQRIERETAGLGEGRVQFLGLQPWTPAGAPGRLQRASCYEPLAPDPWPNLKLWMGGSPIRGQLNAFRPGALPGFYDVSGVERIFSVNGGRVDVAHNESALPRAYLLHDHRVMDREEIFELLRNPEHPLRHFVALEETPGFEVDDVAHGSDSLEAADITSYRPEEVRIRIRIRIRLRRDSLLVLSDTWYPGWIAEVDGEARKILRANGMFRAVRVGPGDSEVRFVYRPASLRHGAMLSLAGLGVSIAIAVVGARRAGRDRRP